MKALLLLLLAAAACSKKPDAAAPAAAVPGQPPSVPDDAPKSPAAPVSGTPAAPDSKLGRTYDFVVKALRAAAPGGDAASAAALDKMVNLDAPMLGDPTAYLNSVAGGAPHSPITFGMFPQPQSVHVRPGPGRGQYTVEQHGDDVATCLTSTIVKVTR